ncbi:hypothetical protein [Streptomyces hiroshimensis]|uniref:Uncharacterized protein n=1 Tax=Streptomyces hiroshimensis TaxID=66424 RepID=A0ABQ2Y530_9ACTN|nr:hypothetical protein [Streptomyces hiroshimensis]GGX62245.1 hypothetical protein GCM10010324_03710 [Streptomyces hiroshimensis]
MAGFEINKSAIDKLQREIAKEFERANRKHPVRISVEVEAPRLGAVALSSVSGIEFDPYLSRLLIWLYGASPHSPSRVVDVAEFLEVEGLSTGEAAEMALRLKMLGLVRVVETWGGTGSEVYPTDDGVLEAKRLLDLRADTVARFRHTCDVLLQWALRTGGRDSIIPVLSYAEDPQCNFAGDRLAEEEVLSALDYLVDDGLVHVHATDNGAMVCITAAGTRCVLAGGSVSDYLSRQPNGGDTYNITHSQGFVAGSQQHVVQNNDIGLDASKLAEFAQAVRQFAPTLGGRPTTSRTRSSRTPRCWRMPPPPTHPSRAGSTPRTSSYRRR